MANIFDEIIKPGSVVKRTIISVFTWPREPKGSRNAGPVQLEFEDGSFITYDTEMYLDLPNGEYELIDEKWIAYEE